MDTFSHSHLPHSKAKWSFIFDGKMSFLGE